MATEVNIGTFITRRHDIHNGRPCISGTGVTVQRIVGWYKLGLSPEEIAEKFGHISLAQVHAALAYYHANKDEIEYTIIKDKEEGDNLEKEHHRSQKAS